MVLLSSLLACSGGPDRERDVVRECDAEGDAQMLVVRELTFVRETDGVSEGFDLDGLVSPEGGADGCGIPDLLSPDGDAGVDNAFAYLLPALELTEAAAVETLIAQAIHDGNLLVTLEFSELDDPADDRCVDLLVGKGMNVPLVGSDDLLLPGQTIDRDPDAPTYEADASLADGMFDVPLEILLPVSIFDVDLQFQLLDGRMRGTFADDGSVSGIFAGGVDVDYLLSIAAEENVDPGLEGILAGLLGQWSDLAPDETGTCKQLSMTFAFEAVPAFFYE